MAALLAALFLMLLVVGCGGSDSTPEPEVLIVTATYTPQPVVVVVTATHTATPEGGESDVQPSSEEPTATLVATAGASPTPRPTKVAAPEQPADTPTPKPTSPPTASLASYRVVYSHFYGGDRTDEFKYGVWMMRGDGSQDGELLHPAFEPSFSRDGNLIAYYRPFIGIWIYDMVTKSNTPLVEAPLAEFGGFSPDGQRLTFHEWNEVIWTGDVDVYVINADGSGRTKLVPGIRPAWSPNSDLIAFDTCRGTSCGVYVVQPDGQGFRQVTSDAGGGVAWSPNGKRIAYHSGADGDDEIYVVNLDGTGRKQLTHNAGNDALPTFSPDGQYIYFISDQSGTSWAIRAIKADGSDVKTVHEVSVIAGEDYRFSRLWVTWW